MTETTRRIIEALRSIPPGKVSCYRDAALAAGIPNGARQVVRVLHSMSEKYHLPWHRVIRADGHIALRPDAGGDFQRDLLRSEGVGVSGDGFVDLKRYSPW
jgi:methylated-DNA-protein-cysteine methyltransferase-like protein